jgi:predicted Zn-dependent protease
MSRQARFANEATARALMRAGNYAGAEQRLRTMLGDDPEDARALALLAHCRLEQADQHGALEAARSAANIEPEDDLVKRTLVQMLLRSDKPKEAAALAEQLAADTPDDSHALFQLGYARLADEDHVGAHEVFAQAEAAAGDDVIALINMAMFRAHQWRWDEAGALAQRAMTIDPTHPEIFRVLAECALVKKRIDDAFELALEALRLGPGDRATMKLLARVKARRSWLKPLHPFIDWIIEMDRGGLIGVPLILAALSWALFVAVKYDMAQSAAGRPPVVVFCLGLGVMLVVGAVSYGAALSARLGIARDLRRVALPRF